MTKSVRQMLNAAALVVEFIVFAAFLTSGCLLYNALANYEPTPAEQRLDNNFVPYILLFVLAAGACVFGLGFLIHFVIWRAAKKREASGEKNRLA